MDNECRLEGGKLLMFTRNGIWQARIPIGDICGKSLKTSNETDAQRAAVKLFYVTGHKLDEGQPVQSRTFSAVLNEFENYREDDKKAGKAAKRTAELLAQRF